MQFNRTLQCCTCQVQLSLALSLFCTQREARLPIQFSITCKLHGHLYFEGNSFKYCMYNALCATTQYSRRTAQPLFPLLTLPLGQFEDRRETWKRQRKQQHKIRCWPLKKRVQAMENQLDKLLQGKCGICLIVISRISSSSSLIISKRKGGNGAWEKKACCISGRWKQMEGNREFRLICILGPSSTGKHQYFRCRNEADNFLGRQFTTSAVKINRPL